MATLSKRLSKLFLRGDYNSLELPRVPSMDSGYQSLSNDDTPATPSASSSPKKSPQKLLKAKSMGFNGLFGTLSDNLRWSASLLHTKPDPPNSPEPDILGLETPKKQKSRSGRWSATWNRSTGRSNHSSKRRWRHTIQAWDVDLSPSPVTTKKDTPTKQAENAPELNVDIPTPSLSRNVAEVVFDSTEDVGKVSPKLVIGPMMLWPDATRQHSETAEVAPFRSDGLRSEVKDGDSLALCPSAPHYGVDQQGSPYKTVQQEQDDRTSLPSYRSPNRFEAIDRDQIHTNSLMNEPEGGHLECDSPIQHRKKSQTSSISDSYSAVPEDSPLPTMGARSEWDSMRAERTSIYEGLPTYDDDSQSGDSLWIELKMEKSPVKEPLQEHDQKTQHDSLAAKSINIQAGGTFNGLPKGVFRCNIEADDEKPGSWLDSNDTPTEFQCAIAAVDRSPRSELDSTTQGHVEASRISPLFARRRPDTLSILHLPKPNLDNPYEAGLYAASFPSRFSPELPLSPDDSCAVTSSTSSNPVIQPDHLRFDLSEPTLLASQPAETLVESWIYPGFFHTRADSDSAPDASFKREGKEITVEDDANEKMALFLDNLNEIDHSRDPLSIHIVEQQTCGSMTQGADDIVKTDPKDLKTPGEILSNSDSISPKFSPEFQTRHFSQPVPYPSSCTEPSEQVPSPNFNQIYLPSPNTLKEVRFTSSPVFIEFPDLSGSEPSSRNVSDSSSSSCIHGNTSISASNSFEKKSIFIGDNRSTFRLAKALEARSNSAYDRFIGKIRAEEGKENQARACMAVVYKPGQDAEEEERPDQESVFAQSSD